MYWHEIAYYKITPDRIRELDPSKSFNSFRKWLAPDNASDVPFVTLPARSVTGLSVFSGICPRSDNCLGQFEPVFGPICWLKEWMSIILVNPRVSNYSFYPIHVLFLVNIRLIIILLNKQSHDYISPLSMVKISHIFRQSDSWRWLGE